MKTTTRFALASTVNDGLLVKNDGNYEVATELEFDSIEDYNQAVKKFDSIEEANKFIEENEYWALTPVEFKEEK